jgi:DNA-binding MarR family transcriptional regulator
MKLFVSWSGRESKRVANFLREWFPLVIQAVEPWMSSEDIGKGARWSDEVSRALRESEFAVLCITPNNAYEPWINFEAGAIFAQFERARVSPLLIQIPPEALPETLSQFQCTTADKDDFHRLIKTINAALEKPLPSERLATAFEMAWPKIEPELLQPIEKINPKAHISIPTVTNSKSNDLDSTEERVLTVVAHNDQHGIQSNRIAAEVDLNQVRTDYHLNKLEKADLVHALISMSEPIRYILTDKGREYLVEHDLF